MPTPSPKRFRTRAAAAGLGLGLAIASFAVAGPAAAETATRDTASRDTGTSVDDASPAPVDTRRGRPTRDLEVLRLSCNVADGPRVAANDATRVHIGCRWRAAESKDVAGYQLWRIVDRGHRELVARGRLDMLGHRDVVSADANVVRYAVIAVNEHGRRIGQSRVERIVLDDRGDRPVRRHRRVSQR
jgi:hypothetical protein